MTYISKVSQPTRPPFRGREARAHAPGIWETPFPGHRQTPSTRGRHPHASRSPARSRDFSPANYNSLEVQRRASEKTGDHNRSEKMCLSSLKEKGRHSAPAPAARLSASSTHAVPTISTDLDPRRAQGLRPTQPGSVLPASTSCRRYHHQQLHHKLH